MGEVSMSFKDNLPSKTVENQIGKITKKADFFMGAPCKLVALNRTSHTKLALASQHIQIAEFYTNNNQVQYLQRPD